VFALAFGKLLAPKAEDKATRTAAQPAPA
jgi:hypothetical protein